MAGDPITAALFCFPALGKVPDPNTHTVGAQGFVWLSQSADLGILAPAKDFTLSGRGVLPPPE